jgi:hypothetical protein
MTRMALANGAVLAALFAVGCDSDPREPVAMGKAPATAAAAKSLPRPDTHRIHYDAARRTLALYPLPDGKARWMLASARNPRGEPVADGHTFSNDVDIDSFTVFYTTEKGLNSPRVSLRELVTMQIAHRN